MSQAIWNDEEERKRWFSNAHRLLGGLFERRRAPFEGLPPKYIYGLPDQTEEDREAVSENPRLPAPSDGVPSGCLGACWKRQGESRSEIYISTELRDAYSILTVMTHELIHAMFFYFSEGQHAQGHHKLFRSVARKVGLEGPMDRTYAGSELALEFISIENRIGVFPFDGYREVYGEDVYTGWWGQSTRVYH